MLVRASWQMRAFEERFIITGTPYRVIGGPRFFERPEIRDAMAYLRLMRSPADDLAFQRVVNVPKRGVGDTTIQKLHVIARQLQHARCRNAAEHGAAATTSIKGPAEDRPAPLPHRSRTLARALLHRATRTSASRPRACSKPSSKRAATPTCCSGTNPRKRRRASTT